VVGLVRGVHGLKGALRVELLSDEPGRYAPGSVLHPEGSAQSLTVAETRQEGPGLVVRFEEIADRAAAQRLAGIYLETALATPLPADTYYWHEVIGCSVETEQGEPLGVVEDVERVGEAEVYVVRGMRGELLVPAVRSVVRELAPAERRMVVDGWALGLNGEARDESAEDAR
jgi:16S rRNA processing protein RimM